MIFAMRKLSYTKLSKGFRKEENRQADEMAFYHSQTSLHQAFKVGRRSSAGLAVRCLRAGVCGVKA